MTGGRRLGARAAAPVLVCCLAACGASTPGWATAGGAPEQSLRATLAGAPRLVALGDSVPLGENCDCTPYPQLVGDDLARRYGLPITSINDAVSALTADELATQLDVTDDAADAELIGDVSGAGVVLLTVGANDVVAAVPDVVPAPSAETAAAIQQAVDESARAVGRVLDRLRVLAPRARVVLTDYWNLYPDGAQVVPDEHERAGSDALTRAFNARLVVLAATRGVSLVDVYTPFKADGTRDPSPLLLDDGDHPSAPGHREVADAILQELTG